MYVVYNRNTVTDYGCCFQRWLSEYCYVQAANDIIITIRRRLGQVLFVYFIVPRPIYLSEGPHTNRLSGCVNLAARASS